MLNLFIQHNGKYPYPNPKYMQKHVSDANEIQVLLSNKGKKKKQNKTGSSFRKVFLDKMCSSFINNNCTFFSGLWCDISMYVFSVLIKTGIINVYLSSTLLCDDEAWGFFLLLVHAVSTKSLYYVKPVLLCARFLPLLTGVLDLFFLTWEMQTNAPLSHNEIQYTSQILVQLIAKIKPGSQFDGTLSNRLSTFTP